MISLPAGGQLDQIQTIVGPTALPVHWTSIYLLYGMIYPHFPFCHATAKGLCLHWGRKKGVRVSFAVAAGGAMHAYIQRIQANLLSNHYLPQRRLDKCRYLLIGYESLEIMGDQTLSAYAALS